MTPASAPLTQPPLSPSVVAYVEKAASPEETSLEARMEPEPVFIDEVPRPLVDPHSAALTPPRPRGVGFQYL